MTENRFPEIKPTSRFVVVTCIFSILTLIVSRCFFEDFISAKANLTSFFLKKVHTRKDVKKLSVREPFLLETFRAFFLMILMSVNVFCVNS